MAAKLKGQCYCRAVTYEVEDAFRYAMICHCKDCQRTTGSVNKPFGGVPVAEFEVTEGKGALAVYGDARNHNAFCGHCGSLLYSLVRDGEWVHVTYGTLLDTPSQLPTDHIFARSRAAWEVIGDDLPQHDTFPGAEARD
ncbi:GFA family protein [Pelagovum pacificum]|uniref:GFA family protein n=1 Tax=Pelagovum pacificum TaxID=2588711 RepID=A0A5C5GBZ6_9RHOB|nr:GFA family protein [Pelagovum pacificum]QQA42419.1 GFA family protein [Pelagovum pacificum]TNY31502.1 GFA family protein [Pelagovum pacificum]